MVETHVKLSCLPQVGREPLYISLVKHKILNIYMHINNFILG